MTLQGGCFIVVQMWNKQPVKFAYAQVNTYIGFRAPDVSLLVEIFSSCKFFYQGTGWSRHQGTRRTRTQCTRWTQSQGTRWIEVSAQGGTRWCGTRDRKWWRASADASPGLQAKHWTKGETLCSTVLKHLKWISAKIQCSAKWWGRTFWQNLTLF